MGTTMTARAGRVVVGKSSRIALAMAGAMTIWHGAAMADSAAPAPSSAEATAPAAVQPFAIGKQLVAVGRHPDHELVGDWEIYYWSDGSFSAYQVDAGTFGRHYSATDDKLQKNWPLIATFNPAQHEVLDVWLTRTLPVASSTPMAECSTRWWCGRKLSTR